MSATASAAATIHGNAFRRILLLTLATEYWARALPRWQSLGPYYVFALAMVTVLAPVALGRHRPWAFALLAALHAGVIFNELPATGNHAYLELIFLLLAALTQPDDEREAQLFRRGVQWTATVVLFYSGLQKVVQGYYFDGSMLTYSASTNSFRGVLRLLLPAAELERIAALDGRVGAGPYAVSSPLLLVVSNLIWLAELMLPVLLWVAPLSAVAALLTLVLLLAIEVGAREVFFGLVFSNALLMFLPPRWHRRAVPAVALVLLTLLLSRFGVLPEFVFY